MLDMSPPFAQAAAVRKVGLRKVALPTEHGSWGFLIEPLVGAMAIAFSWAAVFVGLAFIGAFLARRPFQVLALQGLNRVPVNKAALKFLAAYSLISLIGIAGLIATSHSGLFPLFLAAPIAAFQLYVETTQRGRQLTAELAGSLIMPSSAAAIILAGGGTSIWAGAIWFLFVARFIPSIIYVRNRLNLEKGKESSHFIPIALHLTALVCVSMLAIVNTMPLLVIPAFVVLLSRCCIGLSSYRHRVKAMKIGIWEVIYGSIVVTSLIVGHYTGF